jgi:hypothetical protein
MPPSSGSKCKPNKQPEKSKQLAELSLLLAGLAYSEPEARGSMFF